LHIPELQVGVAPEQPMHAPPDEPQALLAVPCTQVPLVMPLAIAQQPPLHGLAAEQLAVHWWVLVLQVPCGQSGVLLQPQRPPPPAWPPQSMQVPPPALGPHRLSLIGSQRPPLQQKPPPQGSDALHTLMHAPAEQVGVSVSQVLQKVPSVPHLSLAAPPTQVL